MAESIVSFTIERLSGLLIAEGKFLYGVCDEVQEIKVELKRMQCFLKDADERQDGDERVRNWVAEIRDLAYRTEDVLETFAVEVASKRESKGFKNIMRRFVCIFSEGKALHKVGSEIQTIKDKISGLTQSLQTYGIKALSESENSKAIDQKQRQLRISYPHLIEKDFVGMEEDLDQLVSFVVGNVTDHKVILIKGMGGQGKTTIATKIYNHFDVRSNFEAFAWSCITQECDPKKVFQDILRELVPSRKDEIVGMGDSELVQELHKVQLEKKCLVVLDDIWSITDWKCLSPAFPIMEASGSKILLTSRKLKVGFVYELRCLTEEEGWELLQKKAFPRKNDTSDFRANTEIEILGREMVGRCGGLPLAIAALGGLLKDKSRSSDWEMVNKNIDSYLRRGEGIEEDQGAVTHVLDMSYNDLPYCLKLCFMHMGSFPEDHEIDVKKLGLLWIAEGLVSSEDRGEGETMLDVVERYLDELAQRSMVQVQLLGEASYWSMLKRFASCRLHDLMRDMSLKEGIREGFFKVIDSRVCVRRNEFAKFMTSTSCTTKTRRLAIYSNEDSHVYVPNLHDETHQHLRSLLLFGGMEFGKPISKLPLEISGIKEFKFLRVLDFGGFNFKDKDLQGIKELIHLRYLSFENCNGIEELPSFIGNLRYLEILNLRVWGVTTVSIPNVLWKLKRLRHLFLPRIKFSTKDGQKLRLDGLTELETLVSFDTSVCDVNNISRLPDIQFLTARIENNLEDLKTVINYLKDTSRHMLRSSHLSIFNGATIASSEEGPSLLGQLFGCPSLRLLELHEKIDKFPGSDQINFSSGITIIHLTGLELEDDPMAALEKFPNLRHLTINYYSYMGKEMVCSSTGFPQLRLLSLWSFPNLEKWHVDEGAMPNLSSLYIYGCWKLKMLPEGLRFLITLKKMKIKLMPEAFKDRVRVINGEEGEDFYKVRHVPSIDWW